MRKGLIMIAAAATLGTGVVGTAPASAHRWHGHDGYNRYERDRWHHRNWQRYHWRERHGYGYNRGWRYHHRHYRHHGYNGYGQGLPGWR